MEKSASRVASILSSTVIAAAVTLALGWPSHVNAVGNEEQAAEEQAQVAKAEAAPANAQLAQNAAKIGDLDVSATLGKSEASPGRQAILVECNNPTDGRITGEIQVALTRTSGSGGERVMPTPKIAWRQKIKVDVEPGGKLVRELLLPKNIGSYVAQIDKLREAADQSETARAPNVYFGAVAEAVEAPTVQHAQPQLAAMQKSNSASAADSDAPAVAPLQATSMVTPRVAMKSNRSKLNSVVKLSGPDYGY